MKQPLGETEEMCSHRTSCDAEFAKALKIFYQNMNVVRQQFLQLKQSRPPVGKVFTIFYEVFASLSIRGHFSKEFCPSFRNLKLEVSELEIHGITGWVWLGYSWFLIMEFSRCFTWDQRYCQDLQTVCSQTCKFEH